MRWLFSSDNLSEINQNLISAQEKQYFGNNHEQFANHKKFDSMKFNSEGMSDRFMTQDGLQRIKSGSQDLDGQAELQMKDDLDKAIQRGYVRN